MEAQHCHREGPARENQGPSLDICPRGTQLSFTLSSYTALHLPSLPHPALKADIYKNSQDMCPPHRTQTESLLSFWGPTGFRKPRCEAQGSM